MSDAEPADHSPGLEPAGLGISEKAREVYRRYFRREITGDEYFDSITDLVQKPLTFYVNYLCSRRSFLDTRDIVQDVLVRFFDRDLNLEETSLIKWLKMVARCICIDEGRKFMLRDHPCFDEAVLSREHAQQVRCQLAQGVLKSNLQKAFEALTPEQVFVIDMFYFEDVSQGDIAELLGVPLSTVEHHLRIAKLQLGKMIQVTELRELVVNRRPRRKVTHG